MTRGYHSRQKFASGRNESFFSLSGKRTLCSTFFYFYKKAIDDSFEDTPLAEQNKVFETLCPSDKNKEKPENITRTHS